MTQSSTKIVLAGYYGFGNAGDELILRAIVGYLTSSGFSLENLTVLSKTPVLTSVHYGVKSVNRWSPFAVSQAIAMCDLFVLGGGGLLQDSTGRFGLWYYLLLLWLALCFRKRVMILAVGIGSLRWKWNRKLVALTLRHVHSLSVRDGISDSEIEHWSSFLPAVHSVADPVFWLPVKKIPKKSTDRGEKRKICIVLRKIEEQERMGKIMADFAGKIYKEWRAEVVLLPFHPALDHFAIQSFLKEFNENVKIKSDGKMAEFPKVSVLEWSKLDELLELFSGMELVISFRYHAILLAVMMGIPAIGISADSKIANFMQGFFGKSGMKNWVLAEECKSEKVWQMTLELWRQQERFREIVNENLSRYRENALAGLKSLFSE